MREKEEEERENPKKEEPKKEKRFSRESPVAAIGDEARRPFLSFFLFNLPQGE